MNTVYEVDEYYDKYRISLGQVPKFCVLHSEKGWLFSMVIILSLVETLIVSEDSMHKRTDEFTYSLRYPTINLASQPMKEPTLILEKRELFRNSKKIFTEMMNYGF
ncbi:Beta-galactosidase [Dirofilaria immitis]